MRIFAASMLLFVCSFSFAQSIINRDPVIYNMVLQISRDSIEQDVRELVSFYTRHNLSVQDNPEQGIGAAWNWIKAEMEKSIPESGGRLSVAFDDYTVGGEGQRIKTEINLKNVVATLKGTNPDDDRIFLISAHLDSRVESDDDSTSFAPGANDDGSGVAAILEMVRIMSKHEFSATIVFMAVSGEEHGLYGATHMAEKAKAENWNLVAMLNNDMIGNSGSSGTLLNDNMKVRVFSEGVPAYETEQMERMRAYTSGENDGKARQLARYVKETGERYVDQLTVSLIYRNDRFGRGGDHTPFCKLGFTAVRITEFNENYDRTHKVPRIENGIQMGDLPEFVDYEYVRKNAGINLATLANLAMAPYEPENVGISIRGLSNSSILSWEEPEKGKKPAGYYVLMRETYQPVWERKIFLTDTTITLPYSKDNYFFAVQSVDEEGHESLPVFPGPARRR
ncbi:MAG: M28 family metallopeptidase [Prolixibacteraceae bacterium]|nr:M28 family metallopeptidase [Prolixibacteraceae bacterium]